jgi:ferredoxin--NADP+ reductase
MYKVVEKETIAPDVDVFVVEAPLIAKKACPGQFVLVRVDETGERTPLTIADFDRSKGTITIVVQRVGRSTVKMGAVNAGECFQNVTGPLGTPTHLEKHGTVVVIGGGIGIAPAYPVARGMKEKGNKVIVISGARTKDLLFWQDRMEAVSDEHYVSTDDGSVGTKGFVTTVLSGLIEKGEKIDRVFAVGPVPMMRAVTETTRPHEIPTIVSLNPVMVDGTGMCGGCRVSVGGETKFACVDGPEFDGHLVDFEELTLRQQFYRNEEVAELEKCRLELVNGGKGPEKEQHE